MSPAQLEQQIAEQAVLADRAQHAADLVYRQVLDTGLEGISVVEMTEGDRTVGAVVVVNGTSTRNLVESVLHLQRWLAREDIGEFQPFELVGKEGH